MSKNPSDPIIEYRSVFLRRKDKVLFKNFNLTIAPGRKILISGKSGCGKTTLLKFLLGFEQPDKGGIFYNGRIIDKTCIKDIRSQIYYLSQDIDLMDIPVQAFLDQVLAANRMVDPDHTKRDHFLDFLELDKPLLSEKISGLSGGERQRIGLLLCFLLDRAVWLLDEPTAALDDAMKQKIAGSVPAQKATVLIVSHDDVWKENHKNIHHIRMG